jgi:hypothetical protein
VSALALAATVLLAAGQGRTVFIHSVDTDSESAVAVVSDPRFEDHQPAEVPPDSLKKAMRNCGYFTDDEVGFLYQPVAKALSGMEPRDQVRVVSWSRDGFRKIYLYVRNGALQVAYYRGDVLMEKLHSRLSLPDPSPKPENTAVLVGASPTAATAQTPSGTVVAMADTGPLSEDQARSMLTDLDGQRAKGMSDKDYKTRRKEILNRL